jgi:hypothetical protein
MLVVVVKKPRPVRELAGREHGKQVPREYIIR